VPGLYGPGVETVPPIRENIRMPIFGTSIIATFLAFGLKTGHSLP
jgi:hypothetical protein